MKSQFGRICIYLAWITALFSMIISLYFSEIRQFTPCALCWYQRILMYPLTLIIPVGILKKDKNLDFYVLPFSLIGVLIAGYQSLLQNGLIPQNFTPCTIGVSCTTVYVNWFNFITLPLLSFIAFSFISIFMLLYKSSTLQKKDSR